MPIDEPRILTSEPAETAVIRLTVPRDEIQTVMGPAIQELMDGIHAQGVEPAGPLYAHHDRMDSRTFDFVVGVPVRESIRPAGRIERGELPGVLVARAIYRGPYEGLGDAWREMDFWVRESGRTPRPDLWERYLRGPESGDDPSAWETELNRPLIS